MGTITRIRQISPYVFIIFAVLFIVFMVLSDNVTNLATTGGESIQTAAICEVGGDEILYKDYEERVRIRLEQMRNDPQNQGREIDEQQVRNQVWTEMLNEVLLEQAGEELGISVSSEEILDVLLENPPDYLKQSFTDSTGNFDRDLYLKIITNPSILVNYMGQDPTQIPQEQKEQYVNDFRDQLNSITEYLRVQKINEALATTVGAAYAISSPSYVEEKFIDENSSADVSYIFVNQATFPDSLVKITPEEMKAYYDKNKQHYKVKDERRAKVLMFPVAASAEDSARAKKRVERLQTELASASTLEAKDSIFTTAVNEYSGIESEWTMLQDVPPQISGLLGTLPEHEVVGPITSGDGIHFYRLDGRRSGANEVVKASHILINFNNNKDSALAFAKKVMGEVNSSNFAAKAMQYSEDKGSATRGGDLGYFGKGRMVPEFEKAAFGAKVGSIVGPIESQFGYHIIKVDDKKSDELKYSDIVFATTISGNTRNKIKRDAFAAMQQIQEGKNIDTLATQLKLQCIESPYVTEDKPLYNSMFLTSRLFEIKQGEVLEPKEIGNGSMVVVAQLSNVRKAGIGTFEDDSVQIKQKLTKIKKLDLAGKRAEEIFNSIKANAALDTTMALPHNLQVKTATLKDNGTFPGMTSDWAGTTYAFSLPENQINAPVRCDNGYFILDIRNRKIATAEQAKDATDLNKANYTRTLFDSWFQSFRDNTKIKDLRNKYYSEY